MSITDATNGDEVNETVLAIVGGVSAVMHVVVFTIIGELALEDPIYGAVAGVLAGVGAFLFLPWFLHVSALQQADAEDVTFATVVDRVPGSTRLAVFGLGLEAGGIAMIAVGLALDEAALLIGAGAGLVLAVSVFLVASVLLDR